MNKTTKFFAAFASVALMSACSSEEPFVDGGAEDGAGNGQKAYLAVTINSTGDMGMKNPCMKMVLNSSTK